jgi:hypothetical protein
VVKQRKQLGERVGPGKVSSASVGAGEHPLGGGRRAAATVGQTSRQRRRGTDGTQAETVSFERRFRSGGKTEPRLRS